MSPLQQAFISCLTNDKYLPGTLVLARSLRDLGTTKKLAIIVSVNVSKEARAFLAQVYDDVIEVNPIMSTSLEQLSDLGRLDLVATYTKIFVWKQTQYSKVIYMDADVLPMANVDSFFDLEVESGAIAASPDAGWPDIFNSGVFIATPSETTFDDLLDLIQTEETPSFDGGDQGLLNEYFLGKWERLPFTFNVTPSAGYQYVPAFLRFSKDIKNIHFIGSKKPWVSRDSSILTSGCTGKSFDIMKGFHDSWWSVFNRHYFGKTAGDVFAISDVKCIDDLSKDGEGHLLSVPKLANEWDRLKLTDDDDDEEDIDAVEASETSNIPAIFPWEGRRVEAERVFDVSTDFHT